jgi:exodeoxyribonuclease-3
MTAPALRIVSWNIENLAPRLSANAPDSLAAALPALGNPDVLCLQEVRVRAWDDVLIRRMHAALPGYDCLHSLNDDRRNAAFRGGRAHGVATWVRTRVQAQGGTWPWDREGRVVVAGLPGLNLAIVNVYAVNGTGKPYWDHERGCVAGDRHAFKRRLIERIGAQVRTLRETGLDLILIGDWNTTRAAIDTDPRLRREAPHAAARRAFNEDFMHGLDLVDAWRELHPDACQYTWFNRRASPARPDAARVDFALVDRHLMPRVLAIEIDDAPGARAGSDHAPVSLTLAC